MILNIINGNVLDPAAGEIIGERSIVVENDVIVDVLEGQPSVKPDLENRCPRTLRTSRIYRRSCALVDDYHELWSGS